MRPVNLLPSEYRRAGASGARKGSAYIVLGVLGTLLVGVLVYVLVANQVTSRKDETARATAEAQRAEARVNQLGDFGAFAAIKETRIASVRSLAGQRFDWERLLRELARVLPEDAWLTAIDAAVKPDDAQGASAPPAPGGQAAPAAGAAPASSPAAKLEGCAPRQPEVAKLMVRLRRLHGADNVDLTESVKEESAGATSGGTSSSAGSAGGCQGGYKFQITVAFAPEKVAGNPERERPVPSALGGGS